MTPLFRLTLAATNSSGTIQPATLGENRRRSMEYANLGSEPKKSFIYNKIGLGAEPNEPNEPKEPNQVTHTASIPNEPSKSLKTHKSTRFVFSLPNPDRRPLPHQPPNLVHFLIRHRDTPLRPVALHPYPIPQTVEHDVPAGIHPSLPRARHIRRIPGAKYAATSDICSARSASRWCTAPPASARRLRAASLPPAPAPVRPASSVARSPRATAPILASSCSPLPDPPSARTPYTPTIPPAP